MSYRSYNYKSKNISLKGVGMTVLKTILLLFLSAYSTLVSMVFSTVIPTSFNVLLLFHWFFAPACVSPTLYVHGSHGHVKPLVHNNEEMTFDYGNTSI